MSRTAIIHYWLVGMRGGERVLEHICDLFPDADIYTHAVDLDKLSPKILSHNIKTTFIGKLPFSTKHYQKYLPLMPRALEMLDLTDYDLVISSEAGPAKGVITRPDATHVTYCHSPMRYIWDQYHQYLSAGGLAARISMPLFAPGLRTWDVASAARSDLLIANSEFVRARIAKFWKRDALVVYPPIDPDQFHKSDAVSDEYLWIGQLVPYKRPDIAVDAFTASGKKLHVVGEGPMLAALRARAGPNIRFTQRLNFHDLKDQYAKTLALIYTSEEDFGIIPVEVMASGRPILAFGRGGALETVIPGETGMFFYERSAEALRNSVSEFEQWLPQFDPERAIRHARHFDAQSFRDGFMAGVEQAREAQRPKPGKHFTR